MIDESTLSPSAADAPATSALPRDRKTVARAAMLSGPILSTMLRLALPTIVVLIAQTLVGVAETYYVSFLGTDALAGVSLVFPLMMLMTMMSNGGIGGGVSSAVARAIGGARHDDADRLVLHALVLAVVFGVFFSAGVLLLGPILYRSLGGRAAALNAALLYSSWVFMGAVPVWIVNLLAAALRGSGNVRIPALVTFTGALLLIPLSPALIFGIGFIPRLGIAGAGVAVTSYYTIAAVALLCYLARGRGGLTLRPGPLERRLFKAILRVGIVSALGSIQPNLTVIVVTGVVGLFGVDALAGYGVASRLDYLLIPILFGLGTGVLTMVGTNVGAGNLARAQRIAWTGGLIGALFAESVGLFVSFLPDVWLKLFSHDPGVLRTGTLYLHTVGPIYGALGLGMLLGFAAQGGGRMTWPFLGGTARLIIAAGAGWWAVTYFGADLHALFLLVSLGLASYAAVCVLATLSGAIWRLEP